MREAIKDIQILSKPKVDQIIPSGQLSLLEEVKTFTEESSSIVEKSSLINENSETEQPIKPERIECSGRQMSGLIGVSRHALEKHSKSKPLGTVLKPLEEGKPYTIDGKPYSIMCVELGAARSPSKWVAEPF